jgi:hypothetical protein
MEFTQMVEIGNCASFVQHILYGGFMGITIGKRGIVPNWIKENNWTFEQRLKSASEIMSFSSRDWSVHDYAVSGFPDAEKFALWCLINCDTKIEALNTWYNFCDEKS